MNCEDCPLCNPDMQCDTDGCSEAVRYAFTLSCGDVFLFCVKDAYSWSEQDGRWNAEDGWLEFMCPKCLQVTHLLQTHDLHDKMGTS